MGIATHKYGRLKPDDTYAETHYISVVCKRHDYIEVVQTSSNGSKSAWFQCRHCGAVKDYSHSHKDIPVIP